MKEMIRIDPDALPAVRFWRQQTRHGSVRYYYLTEPPVLGIICVRGCTLDDLKGAVVDCQCSYEIGYEGYCEQQHIGNLHGKLTIFQEAPPDTRATQSLSDVVRVWRRNYGER